MYRETKQLSGDEVDTELLPSTAEKIQEVLSRPMASEMFRNTKKNL